MMKQSIAAALLLVFIAASAKKQPNIVFILTDDQDLMLGGSFPATLGATPMPRTEELMFKRGAHAENFIIHTPICCPSRSETWTGRYLHNVKKPVAEKQCGAAYNGNDDQGNACCMHVDEALVNNFTFARNLKEAGYATGLFGKFLNVNPKMPPPGVDAYFTNGGGTYYSPTFDVANIKGLPDGEKTFGANQYSTALIGNYSLDWIRERADDYKATGTPFFAFIGTKANHDPFLPAPWYRETWETSWPQRAPRTGNWNVSHESLSLHHPTISSRVPFGDDTAACIDANFKDRWRCLMSVDDIISSVFDVTDKAGITNDTYFIFTSDHGYSLGQLNLNWDKRNVYEQNIRIHLLVVGPGISPGSSFSFPATNVDLAPTFLEMASAKGASDLDGKSFLGHITKSNATPFRDHAFIEHYYVGLGNYCGMSAIELPDNNFIAVRHFAPSPFGNILYAEFANGTDGNVDFETVHHRELFDLDVDPWQLQNIYSTSPDSWKSILSNQVHEWLQCKSGTCK